MSNKPDPLSAPFGTLFGDHMTTARYAPKAQGGSDAFEYAGEVEPYGPFSFDPAAHALHYGSAMFEGLKAHRQADGGVAIFRLADHVERLRATAAALRMPVPESELISKMVIDCVRANLEDVPEPPGSLYIRPTLLGTEANIGGAAVPTAEALLFVINCPVGDYFKGGVRPLTLKVETQMPRTTPQFGMVKSGANYAMALATTLDAQADNEAVDQVLFATDGDVTETGASNFFLANDEAVITRHLDDSFLHGVTRASVITLAGDLGYQVEERSIEVGELKATAGEGEAFLSGTAAVIAPVGVLIIDGESIIVGDGQPAKTTMRLREELVNITLGRSEDIHGWLTPIS